MNKKLGVGLALVLAGMLAASQGLAEERTAGNWRPGPWGYHGGPWGYPVGPWAGGYGPWGYGGYPMPPPVYGPWGGHPGPWGGAPWARMAPPEPRINKTVLNELKTKLGVRPQQEAAWNDLATTLLALKPQENPLKSPQVLAAYDRLRTVLDEKQRTLADGFKNSLIW